MYTTYDTEWQPEDTREIRIEGMKIKLRELTEQLAWSRDYHERLQVTIDELQEEIDLEVSELMKHK